MPFQIILSTAPNDEAKGISASFGFHSPGEATAFGDWSIQFGDPSQVTGTSITVSTVGTPLIAQHWPIVSAIGAVELYDASPVRFDLHARVESNDGTVAFKIKNLFSNDILHLLALSRSLFLGNVLHGYRPKQTADAKTRCLIQCADGTSAQDCITCITDGVTVKVCC